MTPVALVLAAFVVALPQVVPAQPASVLHVRITLPDAQGRPTPVSRHALLISDDPPSASPRRVVTGPDGAVDVKLRPGTYTVESDQPVAFGGQAYRWRQTLEIPAARDVTLELTAENATSENAEVAAPSPVAAAPVSAPQDDPSFLLPRWQGSVVSIWSPANYALGLLVDAGGLVVTSRRAIGETASVEVQLAPAVKVAGRVLVAYPAQDVAVLWIHPTAAASVPPLPLACDAPAASSPAAGQEVFAIDGALRGQKSLVPGTVTQVGSQGLLVDLKVEPRSAGGPVFAASGGVIGMVAPADDESGRRRGDVPVVRVDDLCQALASAKQKMRDASPPSAALLPVEPDRPFPPDALADAAARRAGASPYPVTSSDFDIAFITPPLVYAARHRWDSPDGRARGSEARWSDSAQDRVRLLTDFGAWSEYVEDVPPVLLVRVTPRFVEGFWTMVGRGAAYTQGVSIPPIKRFKPGFSRLRAYCGGAEVTPVHAFVLERRVSGDTAIREGLYAFDPGALGPACGAVKLVLFSEKAPDKGDATVVDAGVLEQVWRDFAPFRAP